MSESSHLNGRFPYIRVRPTHSQRLIGQASPLYNKGDLILIIANEGDILEFGTDITSELDQQEDLS